LIQKIIYELVRKDIDVNDHEIKGERNQLMIWGFTELRTNKKMKI